MKYKVVGTDWKWRDSDPEIQVTLSVSREQAEAIAEALNRLENNTSGDICYSVKPVDYRPCLDDMMDLVGDKKTKGQFASSRGYDALSPSEQDALYEVYSKEWEHLAG